MYRDSIWASFVSFDPIKHGVFFHYLAKFSSWTKINNIVSSLRFAFLWWYISKLPSTQIPFAWAVKSNGSMKSFCHQKLPFSFNWYVDSSSLNTDRYDTVDLSPQPNIYTIICIRYNIYIGIGIQQESCIQVNGIIACLSISLMCHTHASVASRSTSRDTCSLLYTSAKCAQATRISVDLIHINPNI